jgi:hypothetical protein
VANSASQFAPTSSATLGLNGLASGALFAGASIPPAGDLSKLLALSSGASDALKPVITPTDDWSHLSTPAPNGASGALFTGALIPSTGGLSHLSTPAPNGTSGALFTGALIPSTGDLSHLSTPAPNGASGADPLQ